MFRACLIVVMSAVAVAAALPSQVGAFHAPPCQYRVGARNCPGNSDGPLIGNGDLGAMLGTGSLSNLTFFFTKNDFWALNIGVEPGCRYGTYNNTLFVPNMTIHGCVYPQSNDRNQQSLISGLTISPLNNITTTTWYAEQQLSNATLRGSFGLSSGGNLTLEAFVAAPTDATTTSLYSTMLTRLTLSLSAPAPLELQCEVYNGGPWNARAAGTAEPWGGWVLITSGAPPIGQRAGLSISAAVAYRILGGAANASGQVMRLAPGGSAWLAVVALSNVDVGERNPLPAAAAYIGGLTPAFAEAAAAAHAAWWADAFWSRSSVSLPTRPVIEGFWYGQNALMGMAVRFDVGGPNKTTPGISSAWIAGGSEHNGFTIDYNAEAQFYGVASSNRAGLVYPYARTILDFVANARNESAFFQCPGGLHYPGAIAPFGYYNFNWMHMHSHGSFAALPLIWHWEYTRNASFLTDATIASVDPTATPYALLKGLATWWVCHLVKVPNGSGYFWSDLDDCAYEDSNYYTRPFWHPQAENLCNATGMAGPLDPQDTSPIIRNPAISLGFLSRVLAAAIDASSVLGVDADLRPVWAERLANLAPFPTVTLEDPFNKGVNMTVFTAQEHPLYFMGPSLPGQLNPLAFYALWPSEVVGVGHPLRAVGEATVRTLTGLGSWRNGNAFPECVECSRTRAHVPMSALTPPPPSPKQGVPRSGARWVRPPVDPQQHDGGHYCHCRTQLYDGRGARVQRRTAGGERHAA
jgi:hypothetical protein